MKLFRNIWTVDYSKNTENEKRYAAHKRMAYRYFLTVYRNLGYITKKAPLRNKKFPSEAFLLLWRRGGSIAPFVSTLQVI